MTDLKLLALDAQDLDVISAFTQDAVMKVEDVGFAENDRRFAMLINRFAWEDAEGHHQAKRSAKGARKRSALRFDHVTNVDSTGINLRARDGVLELLSIRFTPADAPEDAPKGNVELTFAGGGSVNLTVECLEARINDLGAAWAAKATPKHED